MNATYDNIFSNLFKFQKTRMGKTILRLCGSFPRDDGVVVSLDKGCDDGSDDGFEEGLLI